LIFKLSWNVLKLTGDPSILNTEQLGNSLAKNKEYSPQHAPTSIMIFGLSLIVLIKLIVFKDCDIKFLP